jgi:hypothetical protein
MTGPRLRGHHPTQRFLAVSATLTFGLLLLSACAGKTTGVRTDSSGFNIWLHGLRDGFLAPFAALGHAIGIKSWYVYANGAHLGSYDFGFFCGLLLLFLLVTVPSYYGRGRARR